MRQERVRTYHARRGRQSALTRERLATLLPRRSVPPGVLAPPGSAHRPDAVVADLGCGHGSAALAYAAAHPGAHVVAVDVHPPGVARMLAAAEAAGLGNLSVVLGDAVSWLEDVPAGSLDAVHLWFPDPWPKARHRARRFVSRHTLALLSSRLTPAGWVLLATDWAPYAAHVRAVVAGHGDFTVREASRPAWRPVAGFEAAAVAAGRPIVELVLERATRIELA